jgi:arsenate reductase-like glutaredoxin family protein
MLEAVRGEAKRLFNTSSKGYRALALKDKIRHMSHGEIVDLLRSHPDLIRRPFVVSDHVCLVGYMPEVWEAKILSQ